jgi:hypothetical protein
MATKQQPKEEVEVKQPVDQIFKPDTVFTLSLQELSMIERQLAPFAWVLSIIRDVKAASASQGATVNTFEEDYQKNEDGSFLLNEYGRPILKEGFWDKHK